MSTGWSPTVEHRQDRVGPAAARALHDLLDAPGTTPVDATPPAPDLPAGGTSRRVDLDPVLLFRFAALTDNAHRIHYDRGYACGVEGYPGPVVQGPLQALLLLDLVRRGQPARRPVAVTFRSLAPAFDTDEALELHASAGPDGVRASARTARGRQTMTATVVLGDPEES